MRNFDVRALVAAAISMFALSPLAGAAPASQVPFVAGLTTVNAVITPSGDYESVQVVDRIAADGVTLIRSGEAPDDSGEVREITVTRKVSNEDRRHSHTLRSYFHESDPLQFPGTTPTPSAVMVEDLRGGGKTAVIYLDVVPEFGVTMVKRTLSGFLTRMGSAPVDMSVLVNGRLEVLHAWHTTGHLSESGDGDDFEFYILDDPENPLVLRWKGAGVSSSVLRIEFPGDSSNSLERSLAEERHVLIYGIYFEFARADIRKVSERTLKEIAAILQKHPDWKLNVAGHTDGIGAAAANLDLSRRRAQSVKAALVSRYDIAPERLTTSGYGASQPQDRNDTAAGRARNRRVELTRP
jgi:outer membrane protein OmpA-like peptidoglycan-associated protein